MFFMNIINLDEFLPIKIFYFKVSDKTCIFYVVLLILET